MTQRSDDLAIARALEEIRKIETEAREEEDNAAHNGSWQGGMNADIKKRIAGRIKKALLG